MAEFNKSPFNMSPFNLPYDTVIILPSLNGIIHSESSFLASPYHFVLKDTSGDIFSTSDFINEQIMLRSMAYNYPSSLELNFNLEDSGLYMSRNYEIEADSINFIADYLDSDYIGIQNITIDDFPPLFIENIYPDSGIYIERNIVNYAEIEDFIVSTDNEATVFVNRNVLLHLNNLVEIVQDYFNVENVILTRHHDIDVDKKEFTFEDKDFDMRITSYLISINFVNPIYISKDERKKLRKRLNVYLERILYSSNYQAEICMSDDYQFINLEINHFRIDIEPFD